MVFYFFFFLLSGFYMFQVVMGFRYSIDCRFQLLFVYAESVASMKVIAGQKKRDEVSTFDTLQKRLFARNAARDI